jgi:hypothetical protein
MAIKPNNSSFRDPCGFIFYHDGIVYRQINKCYKKEYKLLISSGLYDRLIQEKYLIPHEEVDCFTSNEAYKVIKPEKIPFISYPYEWSYSQLKDAALTTLRIQKLAVEYGMSLKDATSYNIQFYKGTPVFIDTLSFEEHQKGSPWKSYRQFCQHFYAPLVLMAHTDIRLNQLSRVYLDGVPLDFASKLLPWRTYFNTAILTHIHMHSKSQKKHENRFVNKQSLKKNMSLFAHMGLIDSLESSIKKLSWKPIGTEWGDYYQFTNYSDKAFDHKKELIQQSLKKINPKILWDFGANEGLLSRIASNMNINTISFDIDPAAVEKNYITVKNNSETNNLPLLLDLTNPSPGIGWMNIERESLIRRSNPDIILALALVHHLAISNNLPFSKIASFFHKLSKYLIIEFVPKEDSQVQKMLVTRGDIFKDYHVDGFEEQFSKIYNIIDSFKIRESKRTLYFMERK